MKTLATMYRGQFRAVEEAVEAWKADHDEAMGVCEFEEVIGNCLALNASVLRHVEKTWDAGFSESIRSPDRVGHELMGLLEAGIKVWESFTEAAKNCSTRGYVVEGAEHIPGALAELQACVNDIAARWPFVRKEDVDKGLAEIAAGKFVAGEDLLRELHIEDR